MKPNESNACSGRFSDWLEVLLTDKCNGSCSWCVEKNGYHPDSHASWKDICIAAIKTDAKNIMLLGGEPTTYEYLKDVISLLRDTGRKVWLTSNAGLLTREFVIDNLGGLSGINLSIHNHDLSINSKITGVRIEHHVLSDAVDQLHQYGASVRLNCNCIAGSIDNENQAQNYIQFAKSLSANSIKFGELKGDRENFIDLCDIFGIEFGLNNDPFTLGCRRDTIIDGMRIDFRQMCGIQTSYRPMPIDPEQIINPVLYYDAVLYNGWQTRERGRIMTAKELVKILEDVKNGKISVDDAVYTIGMEHAVALGNSEPSGSGAGCRY